MSTKRYAYPYAPLNGGIGKGLLVYTGEPIAIEDDEPLPENSSQWEPVVKIDGHVAYFNPLGFWITAPDVSKIDLSSLKDAMLRRLTVDFNYDMSQLMAQYPAAEQMSWAQQLTEAKAVLADENASSPLLSVLAVGRAETVKQIAQKVIEKNDAYMASYSHSLAMFQSQRTAISDAATMEQLPAVSLADLDHLRVLKT